MNKEGWIGMNHMLLASFEGWNYVVSELREVGEFVYMKGQFEGKYAADLDLTAMGMGVIPASGRDMVGEGSTARITVEDGKIVKLEQTGDSGGMEEFVAALRG